MSGFNRQAIRIVMGSCFAGSDRCCCCCFFFFSRQKQFAIRYDGHGPPGTNFFSFSPIEAPEQTWSHNLANCYCLPSDLVLRELYIFSSSPIQAPQQTKTTPALFHARKCRISISIISVYMCTYHKIILLLIFIYLFICG